MKRTYTIPLRRGFRNTQRNMRAKKAISVAQQFLRKHMKADSVKLGKKLNEHIWQNGIKNPPGKVTVICEKTDEGIVFADLEGEQLPTQEAVAPSQEAPEKKAEEEKEEPSEVALEEVKGLGPTRIQALKDAGIKNAKQLSETSVEDLTEVDGVGEATAEKILASAKKALE